jgi:DNA-binding NtrC family response regulator
MKRDNSGRNDPTHPEASGGEPVLRIVIMDDWEGPRRAYRMILKGNFDGVQILEFAEAQAAWEELARTDPDLFITDINHAGLSCQEMLALLAERRVKYPILVVSAVLWVYSEEERRSWGPGLDVTFLAKPFDVETILTAVQAALQRPARRGP